MDPTNRRGLLGAGAAAALGLSATTAPASAREIDPELPAHWERLLGLLGSLDAVFGAADVLAAARREIGLIAEHRTIAHGELRIELLRVESRWCAFASWLSNDTGDLELRDAWMARALKLAEEADYADGRAFARMRQSQWSSQDHDARRAIVFADAALRVPRVNEQTRTMCALRAALGHALAGNADLCERHVADAYRLVERGSHAPLAHTEAVTVHHVRAGEARCWISLRPSRAITLYEAALRDWPRDRPRDRGLHQARFALACAGAGERDRAEVEGRKALTIARATKSSVAVHELKRLGQALSAS